MHSPIPRDSRHVLVQGLPETFSDEKINTFFSNFGGVQGVDRCSDGVIVSFTDIRSARKAHNGDRRLDGINFRMSFHDPAAASSAPTAKNPHNYLTSRDSASPRTQEGTLGQASRGRSMSPWRQKFDEWNLEKNLKSRNQRQLNVQIPKRSPYLRKDGPSPLSPATRSPRQGLQGFYIERIPRGHSTIVHAIHEEFKQYGTLADIQFEDLNGGEERRALLIFNSLKELPDKHAMIMGQKCRVRMAEPVDVQVAYNKTVANKGAMAASINREAMCSKSPIEQSIYFEKASRTLYVGGLETNPTEQSLRRRYERFGNILEIDVKNPESPSPFAFLHFADMASTVNAVSYFQHNGVNGGSNKKSKVNFGRSQMSNKLWVGMLPPSISEDFLKSKLKAMFENAIEILYDSTIHQAVIRFDTTPKCQEVFTIIRTTQCVIKFDGQEFRLCGDFATESLLNLFRERLDTRAVLSPPPNPPADMPGYLRHDDGRRRSPARYRRSRSREHGRRRSRSTSRRRDSRKRDKRRGRSSSEESSSSGSSSDGRSSSSNSSGGSRRHKKASYDRRRRRSRERRSYSRSQEREKKPDRPSDSAQPQERAASGDSGFEEPRALEPPPAPPLNPPPPLHKPPPPQAPPPVPSQFSQPPPPLVPPPMMHPVPPQLPPPREHPPPPPREYHPQHAHPANPGPSREHHEPRPPQDPVHRPAERPREIFLEKNRRVGGEFHPHAILDKRQSQEENRRQQPPPPVTDDHQRVMNQLNRGRLKRPNSREPNIIRQFRNDCTNIPLMPQHGYYFEDARKTSKYYPISIQTVFPQAPFTESPYYNKMQDIEDKQREIRAFKEQMAGNQEPRKRSSGSVHSVDARRASGGSISRVESQEEPHPMAPNPLHQDENARMKQRTDSTPLWMATSRPQQPPQQHHEAHTPTATTPGGIQSRSGSISIEDRISKLRKMNESIKTPMKLGGMEPHPFGMAMSGGNLPPPPQPAARPNLHISIPPPGTSFPTTPNSAKSDFSPRVEAVRRFPSTAIPTSSRPGFTPTAAPILPPPIHHHHPLEQQASPIISAPPPPPVLPKTDIPQLKSPPMTPGSRTPRVDVLQTPSSSTHKPFDFRSALQMPGTPKTSHPPQQHPLRPAVERKEAHFGSPVQVPPKEVKSQPQRHDSMTAMRSPPPTGPPVRSLSVSEPKKPQKDTSEYLSHLFNKDKPQPTSSMMKLGKIAKKPEHQHSTESVVREKEHKKHKEHKMRRKEDGSYETKEERARRKELERMQKEKMKKKEKKLEKKKSKEEKEKLKKQKKKDKERKERGEKKKKRKHKETDSEESESESDEEYNKKVAKDQSYDSQVNEDAKLAKLIAGGTTMYDRVKRRSSAQTKDNKKEKALQALKDAKVHKKKRLLFSSSEEDDEGSQRRDSDQSSEDSEAKKTDSESEKEEVSPPKQKKKAKLEKERHVSSESESDEETYKTPVKKSKKETAKKGIFDSETFRADSSDEDVKPPPSRKSKTSTSDESDHRKKHQNIDYHSLFGSDSVDEKKEKKEKHSPSQSKHRKRQPSNTHDEIQAKRSKRGSLSSDISGISVAEIKSRENSVKKEEPMDDHHLTSGSEDRSYIREEHETRPRLVTKAAMKVFEPQPTSSQLQLSEDSDDSEAAELAPSQPLSSSSSNESEVDSESQHPPEEHETVVEESSQEPLLLLEPPPAPPPPVAAFQSPPTVSYEPLFQEAVIPDQQQREEQRLRDLEGELAAQAIADDDQEMAPSGQVSIFDDCEEPIPEYPSHDFIRTEETVLVDPVPVEISGEQILNESFAEEPLPEEEEEEEMMISEPTPMPIHTSTPQRSVRAMSNDFPSPTTLAAHAVAVKSPLSVAVDGTMPAPLRTPTHSIFSPSAHSRSSNDPLTSPVRSTTTPMSIHQSPLLSPAGMGSPLMHPMRPLGVRNEDLMRHHPETNFTPNPLAQSFYRDPTNMQHQQVPLPATHLQSPVHHLNGTSASLDPRGVAAVPSPSHVLSGTSSISSPGTPPSFGKESLQSLVQQDQSTNLLTLVNAIAMQSLMSLNQQNNNALLAGAAKLMLNNLLPQQMDVSALLGQESVAANLQQALLLQQYANLTRANAAANLNAMMTMKKQPEPPQPQPTPRKRAMSMDEDGPEAKQLKQRFDDLMHSILKEELECDSSEDIPSQSVSTNASIDEDQEVPVQKEYSLKEILDFNWNSTTEVSAFRKISPAKLPSPTLSVELDWTTNISPPGSAQSESSQDHSPLSPTLVDRIRHCALTMRGEDTSLTLDDQLEKMPPVWKGRIAIKNTAEVTVQMHYMFGQKEYVTSALSTLNRGGNRDPTLRVGQRMKAEGENLYRLLLRLQSQGTTCLCVPVGNNQEEVHQQARILKHDFAHYFVKKGCAGVASLDFSPKSHIYVFPPNEFTDKFLEHSSPDLFNRIQHKLNDEFSYLFVAIAPAM